ncbi:MAG: NfeD family protein [Phycisphaerae bacterium]|nr:NfeD family protein [Phycisphaerae bacterium]
MWVTIAIIVLLILAAMVMVLFEILTTTFGVLSVLALAALGAAIWQASTISTTFAVVLAIVVFLMLPPYVVLLVRVLPKLPVGKKLFLADIGDSTAAGLPATERYQKLVGEIGVAETLMRPAGAIRVAGERIPAVAESGVIEKGTKVKVVAAGEQNLVVRPVE